MLATTSRPHGCSASCLIFYLSWSLSLSYQAVYKKMCIYYSWVCHYPQLIKLMVMLHLFAIVFMLCPYKRCGFRSKCNKLKTYIEVNKSNNQVISDHTIFPINKFHLEIDEDYNKLPYIYWRPKLHKHLYKAKFKIATPQCSIKLLSKT